MIRFATPADLPWLQAHDHHVAPVELATLVSLGRVLIAQEGDEPVGWLRWNLFWDNTPFMNMLYILEPWQRRGIGRQLVNRWESQAWETGFMAVMTSTQANEEAQHFYRKLGYRDAGVLLLPGEAAEIIFHKELTAYA